MPWSEIYHTLQHFVFLSFLSAATVPSCTEHLTAIRTYAPRQHKMCYCAVQETGLINAWIVCIWSLHFLKYLGSNLFPTIEPRVALLVFVHSSWTKHLFPTVLLWITLYSCILHAVKGILHPAKLPSVLQFQSFQHCNLPPLYPSPFHSCLALSHSNILWPHPTRRTSPLPKRSFFSPSLTTFQLTLTLLVRFHSSAQRCWARDRGRDFTSRIALAASLARHGTHLRLFGVSALVFSGTLDPSPRHNSIFLRVLQALSRRPTASTSSALARQPGLS